MRSIYLALALTATLAAGCSRGTQGTTFSNTEPGATSSVTVEASSKHEEASTEIVATKTGYLGFDRNTYPGDSAMQSLHSDASHLAFTGYWVTPPPGAHTNTWTGKRQVLKQQGWGFLVLANGRLDAELVKARKRGTLPEVLGKQDAAVAVANAHNEGFPAKTVLFLDQEEGGRLLPEQAAYLLAWTEAVFASDYEPGVYASGQLVQDDPGMMIDTIRDIRDRIKKRGLHEVAIFDAQDACPPAPGCTVSARPMSEAGEPNLTAWQYSQSPRRPEITKSCGATYAADGNCYAPNHPGLFIDMDVATSSDPSHGR